jgi:hypothetical protein
VVQEGGMVREDSDGKVFSRVVAHALGGGQLKSGVWVGMGRPLT